MDHSFLKAAFSKLQLQFSLLKTTFNTYAGQFLTGTSAMLYGCEAQEQLIAKSGTVAFVQYDILHWLLKSLYKVDQFGASESHFAVSRK